MAENKKAARNAHDVKSGYEKIAFGRVNDAVRLLLEDEPDLSVLAEMDLFSVAEIKRVKGGGVEIKFYDRMEALACLKELGEKGERDSPLYRALENCAKAGKGEPDDGV